MDVFFWAIDPRVAFWTRFEANFRLGGNRRPLFLNGLTSPRVPGQLRFIIAPMATVGCLHAMSRQEKCSSCTRPILHQVVKERTSGLEHSFPKTGVDPSTKSCCG